LRINLPRKKSEYAVYKGDELLVVGNVEECAEFLGVLPRTIWTYACESRIKRFKNLKDYTYSVKLEDDE
jgi:hypothetical protein